MKEIMNDWRIVQTKSGFEVSLQQYSTLWPSSTYATKREAASRLLQLMDLGPVGPQHWPESVVIGELEKEPRNDQ